MIYGYARISRPTQNIERQIRNILEHEPRAHIIKEAYTGTTQDRPEWMKMLKKVKSGDTIIFDSVSRMSRNAEEGFAEYEALYNADVSLIFLKERFIDTETYRTALTNEIELTGNEIADEYIRATNRVLMILARQQIRLAFIRHRKRLTTSTDVPPRESKPQRSTESRLDAPKVRPSSPRNLLPRKKRFCDIHVTSTAF